MTSRLTYRPYLDGIRALAVILVFGFHAAPTFLSGGFIGVDVFFVLSGYLITRLLVEERESEGRIALGNFYARRMRRLLPAAVLVVTAVALRESIWGSVLEVGTRLREVLATLFYVANWNLIVQADDYFLEGAGASPLRHAWSLAVEEQFYLIWPLLLAVLLLRSPSRRGWATGAAMALTLASVAAMWHLWGHGSVARVYYGTDTRIFQPLIGALLGLGMAGRSRPTKLSRRWILLADVIAATALALLVVAAFTLSGESTAYFQGGALAVAVVTALLVLALEYGCEGRMARLASIAPVVELGRISYGFYLWHWPILLWLHSPAGASFLERRIVNLLQFTLTLAIAFASYRIIEEPIRSGRPWPLPRLSPVGTLGMGLAVLAASGLVSQTALAVSSESLAAAALEDSSYEPCPDNPRPCVKAQGPEGAPVVALVGDSTAQAYDPALKLLAANYGFTYVHAAVGGCSIGHRLLATGLEGQRHKPSNLLCYEETPRIYRELLDKWSPDLIIATSWNETSPHVEAGRVVLSGTPEHLAGTEKALRAVLDTFTDEGAIVAFVDVLPPGIGVACLDHSGPDGSGCIRRIEEPRREVPYNEVFGRLALEDPAVVRVSLADLVCPGGACPLTIDGIVVRYDGGHLTGTFSRRLAPALAERLRVEGVDLRDLS